MDDTAAEARFPCPCCGYLTFDEPPGSYAICPICFWEDDLVQLRFPTRGGANVPLLEAQRHFQRFGACEERLRPYVRPPRAGDVRDPAWRPLDPGHDVLAGPAPGQDDGSTASEDATRPYYWRRR